MRVLLLALFCMLLGTIVAQQRICGQDWRFSHVPQVNNVVDDYVRPRTKVWLPVVVHVVLPEGYLPITEAQVQQQIDVLNADFAGKGQNLYHIQEMFSDRVADTGIRFCLATHDPDGQPTTGISYTTTTLRDIALVSGPGGRIAIHYDQLGGKTGWDPERYINIWVGEYGSFLGSASFPAMSNYDEEIGLVIDVRHFGAFADAGSNGRYSRGHTLTHEMGHFFGLRHIWGEGLQASCDDSDGIDDTPNAAGPNYGCPDGEVVSCGEYNMYENFMDLTDDICLAAFTPGQAEVMRNNLKQYYSGLANDEPCSLIADSWTSWWNNGLTWSYDTQSKRIILYSPESWPGAKTISVFSVDGREIWRGRWDDEQTYLIDMAHWPLGMYIVMLSDGQHVSSQKMAVW